MQNEIWKDIKGFEGAYQVSNLGRVKRLPYKSYNNLTGTYSFFKGGVRKLYNDKDGYKKVSLWINCKGKTFSVHRLVAFAFIDNHQKKPIINHINGIKSDNNVNNLEWCTHSENDLHAYRTGLRKVNKTGLGKTGYKSSTGCIVIQYDLNGNFIAEYGSMHQAEKQTGCKHIYRVCNGQRKTSGGFIWKKK